MVRKGGTVCAYRGCSSKTGENTSLFSFPKDRLRAEKWLKACNREDLFAKTVTELHKNYKLCEKHFEDKYITKSGGSRKHLFEQAIPTMFPSQLKRSIPEEKDSEEPSKKVVIVSDVLTAPSMEEKQDISTPSTSKISDVPTERAINPFSSPIAGPSSKYDECSVEVAGPSSPIRSPVSTQTSAFLSSGTPRKQKLRHKLKVLRKKRIVKPSVSEEKKEWTLQDFTEMCDKFLDQPFAEIVKSQASTKGKKPVARRYSMAYKQFALTLYFLGPRAYAFMSKFLYLPTKRSLERITEKLACKPGLQNDAIFKALEIKVKTMLDQDKHCMICVDEMSLKANLFYHTGRDEIVGLHDIGTDKKELLHAQNACVIMARGLYSNWKQSIAYFFVNSQFKASDLRTAIEECVVKLYQTGLYVDALMSDMGSNFIKLSNLLNVTPENPEFKIHDITVIYLFDPCHLIKAARNNLIQNIFHFDDKKTSWSFVELLNRGA